MAEDWLLAALSEVERTAEITRAELAAGVEPLAPIRADRAAGVPLRELANDLARRGAGPRRSIEAAFREYEHAVAALRTQVVRALVDSEGVTLSELARRMQLSRQAVTRIYKAGTKDIPGKPN